ncbi:MAG: hypothetical protein RLZZ440_2837 [Planctomycetota bacterium]|jgi:hypothetical protein
MTSPAGSRFETPIPMRTIAFAATLAAAVASASVDAAGTGFDPRVITFGESREEIKSTPITQRPYRPLHVYGNSVRRRHQRATPKPQTRGARR